MGRDSGDGVPPIPEQEEDQEEIKQQRDCSSLEIALDNASAILEQKQAEFNALKNKMLSYEEKISVLDEKIKEEEMFAGPAESAVRIMGPVAGALGGTLFGLGAFGATKNSVAAIDAAKAGALGGLKLGDEATNKVLEVEEAKLARLKMEQEDLVRQLQPLQEQSSAMQSAISESQLLVDQARQALERCRA